MTDRVNPNASTNISATFLPRYFRTDANSKFLQATVEQLTQRGTVSKLNGYIGRQNAKATTGADVFIQAPDSNRQNYQLEPSITINDEEGNNIYFKDYQDYINKIKVFGGDVSNHARLNKEEMYSWNPNIDWDKLVNYQNYYWEIPSVINIHGQQSNSISTFSVKTTTYGNTTEYVFTPNGVTTNPQLRLYRGQTYVFEINSVGNPFSIVTERSVGGQYRYTEGVTGHAVENGTITFTVPLNAPNQLFYQSETSLDTGGIFIISSIDDNTEIDIESDILGKKTYTLTNGTPLSNGMLVSFSGKVVPTQYASGTFYVEGVGNAIKLVDSSLLDVIAPTPDYITINRDSNDKNAWSRSNRWVHKDVLITSAKLNKIVVTLNQSARANRPIIEFSANLKLFNFGTTGIIDVDLVDDFTNDVFSDIEGSTGYTVDKIAVSDGQYIIFTADLDSSVANAIYKVEIIDSLIHLHKIRVPSINDVVRVTNGSMINKQFWFNGSNWVLGQQKIKQNQQPVFDVVDENGISFSDTSVYSGSNFKGSQVFTYKVNTTGIDDPILNFPITYKSINNIGDIVFNFNFISDMFSYRDSSTLTFVDKNVGTGYLITSDYVGSPVYSNGWVTNTSLITQAGIRIYKNSGKVNNFDIDIFDDISLLDDLEVKIYINGIRLQKDIGLVTQWVVENSPKYKRIVLTTPISLTDVLTIRTFASQPINSNGYYEIPNNLQNNPLNETISNFSLGEVLDHVTSMVDNLPGFNGIFPGSSNLRDLGNISQYGTKFVRHSGPSCLSLYHITNDQVNIVRAIEQAREDYNKFKRNFIKVAETLGIDTDVKNHVDLIMQELTRNVPKTSPYYFSDMIPFGASVKTTYIVLDYIQTQYPLNVPFTLDALSNRAVGIYLNGVQLLYGHDYMFDDQGFVDISATIAPGDEITIYEYENTDGCFVPETPSKLGIFPLYDPNIYVDTTLITPVSMIQGHDGSLTLAYGDYRDDLLIELEKRIYNNTKISYDPNIFNINDIIPRYNVKNNYSMTEFNKILSSSFYKWLSLIDVNFSAVTFDQNNPFTFNYSGLSSPNGSTAPGYWRGVYKWILDTDRPNICPWEIMGITDKPSWWDTVYGPAPYTSDNHIMWEDISNGLLKEPGKDPIVLVDYLKPFLLSHIPVDDGGNLVSPFDSGIVSGFLSQNIQGDFVFGDIAPVENAWRRSSHFPFSLLLTTILMKPSSVIGVLFDRSRIKRNLNGQLIYTESGVHITASDLKLPSIYSSNSRVQTSGIINYIINYLVSEDLTKYNQYLYDIFNLNYNLCYRVGAFTSKQQFKLILDSKSPLTAGGVFVPSDDYKIILNTSTPTSKITYSGVIVSKLANGYSVNGYSKTQPYFNYYNWSQKGSIITIGGISESYVSWKSGESYPHGQIVKLGNVFYRATVFINRDSVFDNSKYQQLASLPIVGGRTVYFRKAWNRQTPITLPYNSVFSTIQEVVDFLLGYGEYLKDQGFIFDDFNSNLAQVCNWETSAKEFLFWTTQNWSTGQDKWSEWVPNTAVQYGTIVRYFGDYYKALRNIPANSTFQTEYYLKMDGLSTVGSSVISLSPSANKITFSTTINIIDDIANPYNDYEMFRVDGQPISPLYLKSNRDENFVSYAPTNDDGIYNASFYLIQKEHVVIINNTTMFNDLIYDPTSGYKQDRIKVSAYVSSDWYGGFDIPGFIFDDASVSNWTPWKDYVIGDVVRYQSYYYSADICMAGSENFMPSNWVKLSKKPVQQILPNLTTIATQFNEFYTLEVDSFDNSQQTMAQHLIGYQKRQYLDNIIQDNVSEFKFYQGMIRDKGTQNVFDHLFGVFNTENAESLTFYEEWALRVGQYGASSAFDEVEILLDEQTHVNNPQGYKLVPNIDLSLSDYIIQQLPTDLYLKPIGYNSNPFPVVTSKKPFLRSAGYVRESDVLVTLKSIDQIIDQDISNFSEGSYVWCTFEQRSWNVYRYTPSNLVITNVTYTANDGVLTITTSSIVTLGTGDYIGITGVIGFDGFYKINSTTTHTIVIIKTGLTIENPFTHQSSIEIFKFTNQRITNIDNANTILQNNILSGEKLWTDNDGTGNWAVWRYNPVYTGRMIVQPYITSEMNYGRSIASWDSGKLVAISTALGEIYTYSSNDSSIRRQKQVLTTPYISNNGINPNNIFGEVIAMSGDGKWLAVGSPNASNASVIYYTDMRFDNSVNTFDSAAVSFDNTTGLNNAITREIYDLNHTTIKGLDSIYTNQGVVTIYEKDDTDNYFEVSTFVSPFPASNEKFGYSLSFDNDASSYALYIGAPGSDNDTGKVYKVSYNQSIVASAEYNPAGSYGNIIKLSSVAKIGFGMYVVGTGFYSNQQVISVNTVTKTVTLSAAPDVQPSGTINFVVNYWQYDLTTNYNGQVSGDLYGTTVNVSKDNSTLLISAVGKVHIYKDFEFLQTLTGSTSAFGTGISVNDTGTYIAISDPLETVQYPNEGTVTVYKFGTMYSEYQQILNTVPESNEKFGTNISFMGDNTIVVHSKYSNSPSGRIDIYDRYATKWIFSETISLITNIENTANVGFSVGDGTVLIGTPSYDNQLQNIGLVVEYNKQANAYSWSKLNTEVAVPNISKIKKAFVYNKKTNMLLASLDVLDPLQGKIAGPADEEISYKTFYDPAIYSVGTSSVNVDTTAAWTTKQVGKIWWDLSTSKFIECNDVDDVYRSTNWYKLAPLASVDIYEWVETSLKPSAWDAQSDTDSGLSMGISGKSLYSDSVYSVKTYFDNISKSLKYTYYYWVKNKVTVPSVSGRYISSASVANMIANPVSEGYKFVSLTGMNSFNVANCKYLLQNKDVVLSLQYWTIGDIDQKIHSEWKLISNDPLTTIPYNVEQKWFDSLCGSDTAGRLVPDNTVSPKLRYGIENRPRQSMFVNRFEALKQYIEQANLVLIKNQISSSTRDLSLLEKYDSAPLESSRLYDKAIDTDSELQFINVSSVKQPVLLPIITDGKITDVKIINSGLGYITAPVITVLGSGINANIVPIINSKGQIISCSIINSGEGYSDDTVIRVRDFAILINSDTQSNDTWAIYSYQPKRNSFVASIANINGTTLTIDTIAGSITGIIETGQYLYGTGVIPGTFIVSGNGTTWTVNNVQTVTMTTIRSYASVPGWVRSLTQSYNTPNYWDKVNWYEPGYNEFTAIEYEVPNFSDLTSISPKVNDIVKVKYNNVGEWVLLKRNSTVGTIDWTQEYTIIGIENGTIQLKTSLYNQTAYDGALYDTTGYDINVTTELRNILTAIKESIFINDLKVEYLNLFFNSIRYAFSEQTYIDWIFKTSFVKATHNVGMLDQPITYKNDNLADFESYVAEVKPYRTKIREYVSSYNNNDIGKFGTTDFDLPSLYNYGGTTVIDATVENGEIVAYDTAINEYPWKSWLDHVGFKVTKLTLTYSGYGYLTAPTVEIISDSGSGATAYTTINNGKVDSIVLVTSGSGYLAAPVVRISNASNGDAARAVAIIGDSNIRTNTIGLKFDRITNDYSINKLEETKSFEADGVNSTYGLSWAPDIKIGKALVTINGVEISRGVYTLAIVHEPINPEYNIYFSKVTGSITFDTIPVIGSIIEITYSKDVSTLNAADRIQHFYNPSSTDLGKDLSQLMTGVDYGGVIVDGMNFEYNKGWDSTPYASDRWDNYDTTYDDHAVNVGANEHSIDLPYVPEIGTLITVYLNGTRIDDQYYGIMPGATGPEHFQTNINAVMKTALVESESNDEVTVGINGYVSINIPINVSINEGDVIILRKITSDGSIKPYEEDYDTSYDGGNLAYTSATGISPSDVNVDGDGLVTENTSYAPEEIIPGQLVDAVSIKVYDSQSVVSGNTKVEKHVANGEDTIFDIGQRMNSNQSLIVTVESFFRNEDDELLSEIVYQEIGVDYIVNYDDNTITFTTAPDKGFIVTIFSIGVNGSDILDTGFFVGNGGQTIFATKTMWNSSISVTAYAYFHGEFLSNHIENVDGVLKFIFSNPIPPNAIVHYILASNAERTFTITTSQKVVGDNRPKTQAYILTSIVGDASPNEINMIVRIDQRILLSSEYTYIPAFGGSPAGIIFDTMIGPNNIVVIFSSYNNTILGVSRIEIDATPDIIPVQDSSQYYYNLEVLGGIIQLPNEIINEDYIWVVKTGKLLTPGVDFIINPDKISLTLLFEPTTEDVFDIITYNSNKTTRVSYMQFKDMLNRFQYKNLNYDQRTELTQDFYITDDVIYLKNTDNFDIPDIKKNKPGVIDINGERIEYFKIHDNTLSQIRRGTMGTGAVNLYESGTEVQNIGPSTIISYHDNNVTEHVTMSSFSNMVDVTFIPSKAVTEWDLPEEFTSVIPNNYGQCDEIDVFVHYEVTSWSITTTYNIGDIISYGIYTYRCISSHTSEDFLTDYNNWEFFSAHIRLKKHPYIVFNLNISPYSPAGDVQFDADFSVDGTSKKIRLTRPVPAGTKITIVKKTGLQWTL